jgi:two-component system, NtrC family, nitrogen regulation sensor histidine kinase NtrY
MFKIIQNFKTIIFISFLGITLGILTFLTFINYGIVPFNEKNLQTLLIVDLIVLVTFFFLIIKNVMKIYSSRNQAHTGSQTNFKYVSLFCLFTIFPSLLVAIFSLFIFNFGIQNFFNDQITRAVNNSYDVAKNYLEDNKKTIESDIILMSVGVNRASVFYYNNQTRFINIVKSEKILRRVDNVYLIDSSGNILFSEENNSNFFSKPSEDEFNQALTGIPVLIKNDNEKNTSAIMKLENLIDTYLYISRNLDPIILAYLNETEQAVDFYYSVKDSQTGLKITLAIIYIIVVTLLLFLSTVVAISFANRLTIPIINLIKASDNISKGRLDAKVSEIDTDDEFKMLNKNFNNMIERLKKQQDKLLIAERYSAWESVARKLAHEIKNPLTPIQLSIDRLQEKYSNKILEGKSDFKKYLETINRQIKDIEILANEFSNFARMPSPTMKKINIFAVVKRAVDFFVMTNKISINLNNSKDNYLINGDEDQLYRVFVNLIKNSNESFSEKKLKKANFKGKIDIEILDDNDYIHIILIDNGTGITDIKKVMTPYFTTKKTGTGLGLPIVNKIINEHSGELNLLNKDNNGLKITLSLPKIYE